MKKFLELTNACKFSNLFMELACLGSDVNGHEDIIRASFRLGSACIYQLLKLLKSAKKLGHALKNNSFSAKISVAI